MDWFNSKFLKGSIFFLVLTCFSCSNESSKVLIEREAKINSYKKIEDSAFLNKLISNKSNFLLYIFSNSCFSCEIFEPVILNYINDQKIVIYAVDVRNENIINLETYVNYKFTPTLALFSAGNNINTFDEESNSKMFLSSESLKEEMDKYIELSPIINVKNEDDLSSIIKLSNSYIYYYYEKCGDCTYFNRHFFLDYLLSNRIEVYFFEMSFYFENRNDENSLVYKNFTDKFGLSKDGSIKGYKNGVVPTLQKYVNGELRENVIIYNDEFKLGYSDNGEIISLKIIDSYYEDNYFINKTYYANENSALENYHQDTLPYYISKIKSCFNKNYV